MTAAAAAQAPLYRQGEFYWRELIAACQRQAEAINAVAAQHGVPQGHRLQIGPGPDLHIFTSHCPSTSVRLRINYCSWGPMIDGVVTGFEDEDHEFCPEEFTVQLAKDLDGSTVAIYEEGRSFSAKELATFVMQSFRRCYPAVSLPCEATVV